MNIQILNVFKTYSLKRFFTLFFILLVGFAFISTAFLSCGPGFGNLDSEDSGDGGDDDDDDDDEDDEEDDDRDDGDTCGDSESCRDVCEKIYSKFSEQTECHNEGDEKVGRLERVHDLLMGEIGRYDDDDDDGNGIDDVFETDRNVRDLLDDLEIISDSEEDLRPVDLEYYLEIGASKYILAIENNLGVDEDSLLVTTLKWMIDNKDISRNLEDVNDGSKILKQILRQIKDKTPSNHCVSDSTANTPSLNVATHTHLWKLETSPEPDLFISYRKPTADPKVAIVKNIRFSNVKYANFYDALSCFNLYDEHNIFSYAAEIGNNTIFNMAFNLLDNTCNKLSSTYRSKQPVCARAMICWTAWIKANSNRDGENPPLTSGDYWDMAKKHRNKLENSSNNSHYNKCAAKDFGMFF